MSFITKEQVRAYFGQQGTGALTALTPKDDVDLQALIDAACERIQQDDLAGPVDAVDVVEWLDGEDDTLLLRRTPLLAVSSVTEFRHSGGSQELAEVTAATPGEGYLLDPDIAELTRTGAGGWPKCWWPGRRNVRITYQAGRQSVPAVLTTATCELVWHWWQWRRGGSQTFQAGGAQGHAGAGGSSHAVPWRVRQLLGNELRPPALG